MSTLKGGKIGKDVVQEFWIKEGRGRPYRKTRFESLPDDVLLLIFSFYLDQAQDEERRPGERAEEWHALVHVCRRWRCVVFASPRHLRLRLVFTERRSVKEMNDIWPAFPIVIRPSNDRQQWGKEYTHNIITALERNDRVCEISFAGVPYWISELFVAVMKEPFPFLTSLRISSSQGNRLFLPDFFLGGSAPRLRSLHLEFSAFPALRTLLSSSNDLEKLYLRRAGSRYISPDTIVSCLWATTRLKSLHLDFGFAYSHRDGEGPTRIVLPALTHFSWKGTIGYLNDLLASIDAPQLYSMTMAFELLFIQEAPQIAQFIGRMGRFNGPYRANITILPHSIELLFLLRTQAVYYPSLKLVAKYRRHPRPLSSLVQACHTSFLPLFTVERLDIGGVHCQPPTENTEWLEVFGFFIVVKDLCVSKEVALQVVQALQKLFVEWATEVLPALRNLFIEGLVSSGPAQEALEQFITARQLSGHPVAVHPWTPFKVGPEKSMFEDEDEEEDDDDEDNDGDDDDDDDEGEDDGDDDEEEGEY